MIKATKPQLSKIHVLLGQMNLLEAKANLVSQFTNGRETSSKEMTMSEAKNLLGHLSEYDPNDRMRKKVFALAYEAGMLYGYSTEDKLMNSAKLDKFLREKGTVKKTLNKMSKAELGKTVSQFQQIVKHKEESSANKAVAAMLGELEITITIKNKASKQG